MGANEVVTEGGVSDVGDKGKGKKKRVSTWVAVLHCDLIGDKFWKERLYILSE